MKVLKCQASPWGWICFMFFIQWTLISNGKGKQPSISSRWLHFFLSSMCPLLTNQSWGNWCCTKSNRHAQGKRKILVRKKIKIHQCFPRSGPSLEYLAWSSSVEVQIPPLTQSRCLTFGTSSFSDHYFLPSQGYQINKLGHVYILCNTSVYCCCSVTKLCPTLCYPMDCRVSSLRVCSNSCPLSGHDAIQPSLCVYLYTHTYIKCTHICVCMFAYMYLCVSHTHIL